MNDKFILSSQSIELKGKCLTPNADGIYCGVPLSIAGVPSRGGIIYEEKSMHNAVFGKQSALHTALASGGLKGEWGHPNWEAMEKKAAVARILHLKETKVSHLFTRVYARRTPDGKGTIYFADILPCGPKKDHLIEAFESKFMNAAFSIRVITKPIARRGDGVEKLVIVLVTWDGVSTPGFQIASKHYQDISTESFTVDQFEFKDDSQLGIDLESMQTPEFGTYINCESITEQSLLDLAQSNEIIVHNKDIIVSAADLGLRNGMSNFHSNFTV